MSTRINRGGASGELSRADRFPPAGPDAARREEEGEKAGFEKHAVRLVTGEVAGSGDKREEADEAEEEAEARPNIDEGGDGSDEADQDGDHHHVRGGGEPEQGGRVPEAERAGNLARDGCEETLSGQDAAGTYERLDLEKEGEKGGKVDAGQGAEEDPAGRKAIAWTGVGIKKPADEIARSAVHGKARVVMFPERIYVAIIRSRRVRRNGEEQRW